MSYVGAFIRCLILVIFLVAIVSKIRDRRRFHEFVDSVAALRLLPARMVRPAAVTVVAAELAVCALLVSLPAPSLMAGGLGLAGALLGGFAVTIATALRRGVTASCRCFGGSASVPFGWLHVIRNAALALISLLGVYAVLWQPNTNLGSVAITAPFALLVAALTIRLDDVVNLVTPISTSGR
ncbi:MauE/DoxX family redox-associated membrane protein [Micromonospora sp. NPDC048947]|uniref:MauE/DoxX family redox-associated membrane protein n=1 Tax=Micromonospora sp. NPDC048947 TaxID=3154826 RepID=UPI0034112E40